MIGLESMDSSGLNVKIGPPLGVTEKLRSAMAAAKSAHGTEPRASALEKIVANTDAVAALTFRRVKEPKCELQSAKAVNTYLCCRLKERTTLADHCLPAL